MSVVVVSGSAGLVGAETARFFHEKGLPRPGEVYNVGGGRHSDCSLREAVTLCTEISGRQVSCTYSDDARIGDHVWYISDISKFRAHYPDWSFGYELGEIVEALIEGWRERS